MNTCTTLALGACLSLVSLGVSAHSAVDGSVEASGNSYISSGGTVLKTGRGNCLQSGTFSADDAINACEGIADEAAEEVVAEAPAAPTPTPTATTSKIDTREFSEQTLFDTDSAQLNSAGLSVMNGLFSSLSEYKGITGISVTGHTDSRGSEAYNQALSEQRAETVAAQISSRYPDARIEVVGMGESSPVASNSTAEGRQLNRRVDVEVTATRMVFN